MSWWKKKWMCWCVCVRFCAIKGNLEILKGTTTFDIFSDDPRVYYPTLFHQKLCSKVLSQTPGKQQTLKTQENVLRVLFFDWARSQFIEHGRHWKKYLQNSDEEIP